ncbi:MAG TPA: DegT/DnrJ/EryC1/StrS family aminotransferase [Armatimonadota bacterium]|nr:DegT/DnrJ/EryC1/StrS family aminotransferase [Armatimonadota bacterium]
MPKLAINGGDKIRTEGWPGWPVTDETDKQALIEVLEGNIWGIGGEVGTKMLEEFSAFHDAQYGVAVTSGTTALETSLRAARIGPGDEVICPPYTFIATANSVIMVGAIPIFADIDADTYNLDPATAEAAITERTKAIIAVHIGGSPANMDAFKALAEKHDLVLIEDCAQAHGAEWKGTKVGAIGDLGCFSFQSSKNVTAGEGGIILTNNEELFNRAWSIHNVGREPDGGWYDHRILGANLRLTQFQAALIRCGMKRLPELMDRRDACGYHLQSRLDDIPGVGYATMHEGATRNAWHLFLGKFKEEEFGGITRAQFIAAMSAEGIGISVGYNPLYREPMFQMGARPDECPFACKFYGGSVDYAKVSCPVTEHVCDSEGWWLGQNTLLATPADMDDIADAIEKIRENQDELKE